MLPLSALLRSALPPRVLSTPPAITALLPRWVVHMATIIMPPTTAAYPRHNKRSADHSEFLGSLQTFASEPIVQTDQRTDAGCRKAGAIVGSSLRVVLRPRRAAWVVCLYAQSAQSARAHAETTCCRPRRRGGTPRAAAGRSPPWCWPRGTPNVGRARRTPRSLRSPSVRPAPDAPCVAASSCQNCMFFPLFGNEETTGFVMQFVGLRRPIWRKCLNWPLL